MKENYKLLVIALIFCFIGYFIGYGMGVKEGIKFSVGFASQFINFTVDNAYISDGIFRYKNQIGGCIGDNALILNYTGR